MQNHIGFLFAMNALRQSAKWLQNKLRANRSLSLIALGVTILILVGCNTFGGLGKDIEYVGDSMADTADSTKD
jgi:predicted small secreted protein